MLEIVKILESGLLESYCLGNASIEERDLVEYYIEKYPEIKEEVESIRKSLEVYASLHSIEPPDELRTKILNEVNELISKEIIFNDILKVKEINANSKPIEWREIIEGISPPDKYDIHLHNIYQDEEKLLFVGWVRDIVPPEVHDDLLESFLILEGTCTCKVGDEYINLKSGDYFEIPLHIEHSIKVTSEYPLRAILQRKFVA